MTDEIKKAFKIWGGEIIAIIVIGLIMLWLIGCPPTVKSINGQLQGVTRDELTNEVETFLAMAEIRFTELARKEDFRRVIFQNAVVVAQGGTINPLGLITTIAAIFGIGAAVDDIKLRKKLKDYNI